MADELFSVAGQVVLVSGGSRGIGRELAAGFVQRGATVVITGRKQETIDQTGSRSPWLEHEFCAKLLRYHRVLCRCHGYSLPLKAHDSY